MQTKTTKRDTQTIALDADLRAFLRETSSGQPTLNGLARRRGAPDATVQDDGRERPREVVSNPV